MHRSIAALFAFALTVLCACSVQAGTISLNSPSASPGENANVVATGFGAGEKVTFFLGSQVIGSATADIAGSFTTAIQVPASTALGQYHLQAIGSDGGTADTFISVFSSWPMFKNQVNRLSANPLELTINRNNARNLSLSWVGVMGDLVDTSSPAVANGIVYVGSLDGNLYAFNANGCGLSSCNPLWIGQMSHEFSTVSSPAVANGVVFIGSADHKLYAFAAGGCGHNTCTPVWTASTQAAIDSAPLVANGIVYIGSEDHRFYAFRASGCGQASCPPLWTASTGAGINSSPAIANNVVYVGSQDGKLYALNANGCGRLICPPLWTAQVGTTILGSSPAVTNGVVYIASFIEANGSSSNLYAFNAAGCGHPACSPLWTAPSGEFVVSSPAVANGFVYIGSGDDLLYAFNANGCGQSTCQFLWRGEAVGAQAALVSTPAVANGVVYVGENNGMVEVFDANGCNSPICLPLTQLLINNEQIVSSSPAVVNGTVYVGSADQFNPPIGRLYVYKLQR
jgi:outer membrane protein assembly factor BamB